MLPLHHLLSTTVTLNITLIWTINILIMTQLLCSNRLQPDKETEYDYDLFTPMVSPSVPAYSSAKGERTLGWVETSGEIVRPVTMATYLLSNRPSNNSWFYTSNVALSWSSSCSWKPLTNHHKSQIKGWLFKIFRNSSNERCPGFPEVWDWLIGVSPPCDGLHS